MGDSSVPLEDGKLSCIRIPQRETDMTQAQSDFGKQHLEKHTVYGRAIPMVVDVWLPGNFTIVTHYSNLVETWLVDELTVISGRHSILTSTIGRGDC